jgi:hypothetical protein
MAMGNFLAISSPTLSEVSEFESFDDNIINAQDKNPSPQDPEDFTSLPHTPPQDEPSPLSSQHELNIPSARLRFGQKTRTINDSEVLDEKIDAFIEEIGISSTSSEKSITKSSPNLAITYLSPTLDKAISGEIKTNNGKVPVHPYVDDKLPCSLISISFVVEKGLKIEYEKGVKVEIRTNNKKTPLSGEFVTVERYGKSYRKLNVKCFVSEEKGWDLIFGGPFVEPLKSGGGESIIGA